MHIAPFLIHPCHTTSHVPQVFDIALTASWKDDTSTIATSVASVAAPKVGHPGLAAQCCIMLCGGHGKTRQCLSTKSVQQAGRWRLVRLQSCARYFSRQLLSLYDAPSLCVCPLQVCAAITTDAASINPASITFSLGDGHLATVDLAVTTGDAGTATLASGATGTLVGATLEGATGSVKTIANLKAITDLCLVIASATNIAAVNDAGTHTLTVGGTVSGGGALTTNEADLVVSMAHLTILRRLWIPLLLV